MAAVEVLQYGGHHPGSDYGVQTTQPWTIGWDEEDVRMRLRGLAQAWVALQSRKAQDANSMILVRKTSLRTFPKKLYIFIYSPLSTRERAGRGMAAVSLSCSAVAADARSGTAVCGSQTTQISDEHIEYISASGTYVALQTGPRTSANSSPRVEMPSPVS